MIEHLKKIQTVHLSLKKILKKGIKKRK